MKSSIKIIKPNQGENPEDLKPSERENSVERSTREIVSTVKSWIVELQQRKCAQVPQDHDINDQSQPLFNLHDDHRDVIMLRGPALPL
jgi:hypothetical protein